MRIVCSTAAVNLSSRGSAGCKGVSLRRRKAIRSTISIVKKKNDAMLMLCTARNLSGTVYKLYCNIEEIFSRMVEKGMATLRLKEPHMDLQISLAAPNDLDRLLKTIKLANRGQSLLGLGVLSTTEPVSKSIIKKETINMKILSRKDYPLSGFPSSLRQLLIDGCQLKKFDTRILRLRYLTTLSLVNNKLHELPNEIADMECLTDLNVENNLLSALPKKMCDLTSKLNGTLKALIINKNKIRYLPENIGNLSKLMSLHSNNNLLRILPYDIGRLKNLKFLYASGNKIRFVPFSLRNLSLMEIDVSQNDFTGFGVSSIINRIAPVTTLQDLACSILLKQRIPFEENDITQPCHRLIAMARKCVFCPTLVFRSYIRMTMKFDLHCISETVKHYDLEWRKNAPIGVFICSRKCFERYNSYHSLQLFVPAISAR